MFLWGFDKSEMFYLKICYLDIGNSNHLQKQTQLINSLNNIRTRFFLSNHWPPLEDQTLTTLQVEIDGFIKDHMLDPSQPAR